MTNQRHMRKAPQHGKEDKQVQQHDDSIPYAISGPVCTDPYATGRQFDVVRYSEITNDDYDTSEGIDCVFSTLSCCFGVLLAFLLPLPWALLHEVEWYPSDVFQNYIVSKRYGQGTDPK